ncbi:hypothetical protein ROSINTL182_06264 [Roseburia intestinalis L1-82]|uniref:Uncharacterized protein n=1 Tax=Roseburia intestinalis L1-82 TaxID=536231 RepID=C7G8N8_9FIRM|nr:hypothetical protein ROSINTL182_06264 [Roseburia intestinalis L1-82]
MFHHCLSISASFPELFFFSYKRIPVRRISLRIKETDSPGYLAQTVGIVNVILHVVLPLFPSVI